MVDHFSCLELARPTTDLVGLIAGFSGSLEKIRIKLDAAIYFTCACGSPSHNAKLNGHPHSLRLVIICHWSTGGCCAVDVAVTDGQYRDKLIILALDQDSSVGFASNLIHLDQRPRYCGPAQVIYNYSK